MVHKGRRKDNETDAQPVLEIFTAHLVTPDVLPLPPDTKLILSYDSTPIGMGDIVNPEIVESCPTIDLSVFDSKAYYTLIMTDPDAPNRALPTKREYLCWLVVNITKCDLETGQSLVPYKAPWPERNSGLHRYVFVLLEQVGPLVFDMNDLQKIADKEVKSSQKESLRSRESIDSSEMGNRRVKIPLQKMCKQNDENVSSTQIGDNNSSSKTVMGYEEQRYRPANTPPAVAATAGRGGKDSRNDSLDSEKSSESAPKKLLKKAVSEDFERSGFSTKAFMSKYLVRGVAAANFFQSGYEAAKTERPASSAGGDCYRLARSAPAKPQPRSPSVVGTIASTVSVKKASPPSTYPSIAFSPPTIEFERGVSIQK